FDSLHYPVLIGDRDEIIDVAGESKKEYLNKHIGSELEQAVENRTPLFETEPTTVEMLEGQENEVSSYCLSPIIANGDPIGCVIMFAKDKAKLTNVEEKDDSTVEGSLANKMV